jgi:hypothetical protein
MKLEGGFAPIHFAESTIPQIHTRRDNERDPYPSHSSDAWEPVDSLEQSET